MFHLDATLNFITIMLPTERLIVLTHVYLVVNFSLYQTDNVINQRRGDSLKIKTAVIYLHLVTFFNLVTFDKLFIPVSVNRTTHIALILNSFSLSKDNHSAFY